MTRETRLIDAFALAEEIESMTITVAGKPARWNDAKHSVLRVIAEQADIDPESLRPTGRWILTNEDYEYLTCSVCGGAYYTGAETFARAQDHLTFAGGYKYCPNCGAKMEG